MSIPGREGLAAAAKSWALALTQRPSVTGSADEASFGPWLAGRLAGHPVFQNNGMAWTLPVAAGDPRQCIFLLLRGRTSRTVILSGHYDTVSVDDYGPLRSLATEPQALAEALAAKLEGGSDTPAAARARADLATGDFLPGRGLLDMKAGLAAGLAACEAFAAGREREGNLLFIAVPDEENNSAGARAAAPALREVGREHGLDFAAAINLDAIADNESGSTGRVIALGTVGKLLPTAFVVGLPTHSGFPLNGLNAGALAAAIAARVEWARELTDELEGRSGTPPSLLSLRDGKGAYDVTTPASAFLFFNVLSYTRSADAVLDRFDALCRQAASTHAEALRSRAGFGTAPLPAVALHRYADVEAAALAGGDENREALRALGAHLAGTRMSLPEQCRAKTERAWELSGFSGPAIVTGFGSIPYLPTNLSGTPDAVQLLEAARKVADEAGSRHGATVSVTSYFAGISDMSFFGEADEASLAVVAANTPLWREGVRWPDRGGIANLPTVNIGPWGRDYHTPLERLHEPYAFDVLPGLLLDTLAELGIAGGNGRIRNGPQKAPGSAETQARRE